MQLIAWADLPAFLFPAGLAAITGKWFILLLSKFFTGRFAAAASYLSPKVNMQKVLTLLMVSIALTAGVLMKKAPAPRGTVPLSQAVSAGFTRDAAGFNKSARRLHMAVTSMDSRRPDTGAALAALRDCRHEFKKIENLLSYFFPEVCFGINGPPVYEAEEPFMEWREPRGLQVIESLLTERIRPLNRERLSKETVLLVQTTETLGSLMFGFTVQDSQLLQSVRLAVIRISTLGITGYDAPELKTGLAESAIVSEAIREQIGFLPGTEELSALAGEMTGVLKNAADFNRFDRLAFCRNQLIPFQSGLRNYCRRRRIRLPQTGLLADGATDIFAAGALRPNGDTADNEKLISLGRFWFSDRTLSRGNVKSCSSCHDPAKSFTDGLTVSAGIRPGLKLKRNAPTLLYSAYQYHQFWDGRATGLSAQIADVLHNRAEMDIDSLAVARRIRTDLLYRNRIETAFPGKKDLSATELVAFAVGAYVRTLGRFNSPFDLYLRGEGPAISSSAANGFNLFMGKAKCGTCHFAPLFNGTLPPEFDRTEFEVLGTTANTDFRHPRLSADPGRFAVYPLPFNRYSFKTPTVRNAGRTAPFMHNGRFNTLDSVLVFYNNGGGAGMGIPVPGQTLSADSLHLSRGEMNDIIAFINTLTDQPGEIKK